jgi:DNA-directed RNA polymerase subunit omega
VARITIEDCLEKVENRYELVHLAVKRVKQLKDGGDSLVRSKNKDIVTALREIAASKVRHCPIAEYEDDEF